VCHKWHATLLSIAILVFSIGFNTIFASKLPLVKGVALVLHIVGFFAIIIPLWVTAPHPEPKVVLLEFTNNVGWSSLGISVMVGLTTPAGVLVGYDCSVHMCELYSSPATSVAL
jgi:choline transport protein